jgi:hypothetical protein
MTDSFGDGWNSNILAIKQLDERNAVVGTFGAGFTTGSSSGPLYITILGNYQTQIIVFTLGTKTNEVGFTIKTENGNTIATRTPSTFTASTVLATFCPLGGCPSLTSTFLTITMTDSKGDGWNGNVLGVMQDEVLLGTFGEAFTSGTKTMSAAYIWVEKSKFTDIIVK